MSRRRETMMALWEGSKWPRMVFETRKLQPRAGWARRPLKNLAFVSMKISSRLKRWPWGPEMCLRPRVWRRR